MMPWLKEINPLTCNEGKGENHNNVTKCLHGQRVREENRNTPLYSSLSAPTATAAAPVGIVSLNNVDLTLQITEDLMDFIIQSCTSYILAEMCVHTCEWYNNVISIPILMSNSV